MNIYLPSIAVQAKRFVMQLAIPENERLATMRPTNIVLTALISLACAGRGAGQEPVTDIERIALGFRGKTSEMPDELASAYRSVFVTSDDDAMAALITHESSSISLKAAWRLAELKCTTRPGSEPLTRFLGYVEGRTKAKLPLWWESCVLASRFDYDDRRRLSPGNWPQVDADLFPICNVELGDGLININSGKNVSFDGDSLLWEAAGTTTRLPRALLEIDGKISAEWAAIHTGGERIYFAAGSDYDGSYTLTCLTLDGTEIWRSLGWGIGRFRGGASGLWWCACEMATTSDEIIVFGRPLGGLFLEAFDLKTGEPVYRFSTRYIEEAPPAGAKGANR